MVPFQTSFQGRLALEIYQNTPDILFSKGDLWWILQDDEQNRFLRSQPDTDLQLSFWNIWAPWRFLSVEYFTHPWKEIPNESVLSSEGH